MNYKQEHSINKVILDVETNSKTVAYKLKDNLDMFLKNEIFPYLESYFNKATEKFSDNIIQIDQLTIEIQTTSTNDFIELKRKTKEAVTETINNILETPIIATNENVRVLDTNESNVNTLIHFLKTGTSPWWSNTNTQEITLEVLLKKVLTDKKNKFHQEIAKIIHSTAVQERLIKQFDTPQIVSILEPILLQHQELYNYIESTSFQNNSSQINTLAKQLFWKIIIQYSVSSNIKVVTESLEGLAKNAYKKENNPVWETAILPVVKLLVKAYQKITNQSKSIAETNALSSKVKEMIVKFNLATISNDNNTGKVSNDTPSSPSTKNQQPIKSEDKATVINKNEPQVSDNEITRDTKGEIDSSEKDKTTSEVNDTQSETSQENKISEEVLEASQSKEALSKKELLEELNLSKVLSNDNETVIEEKEKQQAQEKEKELTEDVAIPNTDRDASARLETNTTIEPQDTLDTTKNSKENATREVIETIDQLLDIKEQAIDIQDEYYIKNAGLIIIHPYLKHFLQNCDLLANDGSILDIDIAVHALHYTATKKENRPESEMVFEKFMCGVPVSTIVDRSITLPDHVKSQSEELLKAVLQNWEALKNASPDLLRNEFLQRPGKISFKDNNPKLFVERKTQDILLDRLPWNIGICKLPWSQKLLFTNW